MFFFGTSELDTGNWLLNDELKDSPFMPTADKGYYEGRWQSGPAWSDYLAQALGHDAKPSLAGGQNYAYEFGWLGPVEGLPAPSNPLATNTEFYFGTQVDRALTRYDNSLPSSALFVISIGSNDADVFGRTIDQAAAVADLAVSHIQRLVNAGAMSFLVQTLGGPTTNSFATTYNAALLGGLGAIGGIDVSVVDTRTFNQTIVLAPGFLAGLGITDLTGNCLADAACQAAAIAQTTNEAAYYGNTHLLFDDIHRDTKVAEALANYAVTQLPTHTVPEPGTIALVGLGLVGMGVMRRKRG